MLKGIRSKGGKKFLRGIEILKGDRNEPAPLTSITYQTHTMTH